MSGVIDTVEALEGVIGRTPGAMHLKVIDHLDAGALRWIGATPFMVAGVGDATGMDVTLGTGAPGFVDAETGALHLPIAALDDPAVMRPGAAFGSLFLIPGIGETLRVNGRVIAIGPDSIRIAVEECYGHCAKALIRSGLWSAAPVDAPDDPATFVAASRFLALASFGEAARADLSPKGDPAGCMARLDGGTLWFADRPGNRRVDSFRNILDQPRVALALLVPGADAVAIVRGAARLTTDADARARFEVQGKTPLLAIAVRIERIDLRTSPALRRAALWPVHPGATDIDPSKLFVEHIRLNRNAGLGARLASAALAVPGVQGLFKKGLDKDYRDNLY
ncbi:pyridoxamine 5'-phosphate oxidase family protein [Sphingomonadaceae bacterium jetA1]|jgi:predicted pyridoxine 5'-phosphate oxidase superfamily flavin-nucleotide-binding protein|uniref:pyridoxamine 5'-phosphate oxidase family protein n=1 Tax=Facivitalis istanbulensis TaxID=3075838 RepID=UPI003475B54D